LEQNVKSRTQDRAQWYRIDLHLHTPASADYQQPEISYVNILQRAEMRGIDILAFTDHNTVAGYGAMRREVEQLEFLASRNHANAQELSLLAEYHRLLDKILVLPGFEFTATFGFHVLGIFPPSTSLRRIEHVLLSLRVPHEAIESGLTEVGASADVLTAYRVIREAGGIAIAAHVNAAHGVAMWNLDFGGQTRIAYTQDDNLLALEVTDLTKRGRHTTSHFFDGSKPEYPRPMRCIQGSDAHRLDSQLDRNGKVISFGVGERATEARLRDRTYAGLVEMLQSDDFSTTRAYVPSAAPRDAIAAARVEGNSQRQAFHETPAQAGVLRKDVLADICAFANSGGGTLYLGVSADSRSYPVGVDNPQALAEQITRAASVLISPQFALSMDTPEVQGKALLRVKVPAGAERPYALEASKIYVRGAVETRLATRDEIIAMITGVPLPAVIAPVTEAPAAPAAAPRPERRERAADAPRERREPAPRERREEVAPERRAEVPPERPAAPAPVERSERREPRPERAAAPRSQPAPVMRADADEMPRVGVELLAVEARSGLNIYTLRDMQTNGVMKNITRVTKTKAWQYVIKQHERNPVQLERVRWNGVYGLWRKYRRLTEVRYDLVLQTDDGARLFYGIPEEEVKGGWLVFKQAEAQAEDAVMPAVMDAPPLPATPGEEVPLEVETPTEVEVNAVDAVPTDDVPQKKRRRRRGGKRRNKSGAVAAETAAPVPPEPARIVTTAETPAGEAKKVGARRRGGKAAKADSPPAEAVSVPALLVEAAAVVPAVKARRRKKVEETPAPLPPAAPPEVEKAAPKARRRSSKKPAGE
jgi:hypothetical protein